MSEAVSKERFDIVRFLDENCVAVCVALALVALSFMGITNGTFVSIIGVMLCLVLLMRRSIRLDLWIFVPLVIYTLLNGYSTFRTFGTLTEAYFGTHAVYLVIYLAIASVDVDEAKVMRKLCVGWAMLAAGIGFAVFIGSQFFDGYPTRLRWPLGNADPEGIFLVIAWFALFGLGDDDALSRLLQRGEAFVLVALGLTLTMTSFGALAVGAIAMLLFLRRECSWWELGRWASIIFARLVVGIGAGIALYGVSLQLPASWVVVIFAVCVVVVMVFWSRIKDLIEDRPWFALGASLMGVVLVIGMFLIRANAISRLFERIDMVRIGAAYMGIDPLFGVGPFGWFELNREQGILSTARLIHNTLMSTAVELGFIAALALLVIVVRFFFKRRKASQCGCFIAFLAQSIFDLGFFFPGVTGLLMVVAATPAEDGMRLSNVAFKVLLSAFLAFYFLMAVFGLMHFS